MFVLAVIALCVRYNVQRNIRGIHDLLNVRSKALLLFRHIAVSFQARRISLFTAGFPGFVGFAELIDFLLLRAVVIITCMDCIAAEIEVDCHRMELRPGIAAVCRPVPALQLIAQHQHVSQRMIFHAERAFPFALIFVLVEGNGKLEQAVVKHDGRESIHMHPGDL